MSRPLKLLSRAFLEVPLLAGAFLVLCGTVLALNTVDMVLDYRTAVELKAALIAKDMLRAEAAANTGTRFVARYRVALPEGQVLEAEEDLPRAVWEARGLGSEHTVLYHPSSGRILPNTGGDKAGVALMGAIGLLLLAGGGLLAGAPARGVLERLRIAGAGMPAQAEVLDVFQTSTSVNRVILWRLRYGYRDASGCRHEGESGFLWPAEAARWKSGSLGEIRYDPQRPAGSVWLDRAPGEAEAPSPRPAAWIGAKLRLLLRWSVRLAIFFLALFAAAVLAELVPQVKLAAAWIDAHRDALLVATLGAALAGIFLLVGSVIVMLMEGGEAMDHTGVENQLRGMRDAQSLPYAARASTYRLLGLGAGRAGHEEFRIADFRAAIARGALLRDPVWRRRACAAGGATLMFFGVFGTMIVLTPLAMRLLLAGVVLYAVARVVWAFVRA